MSRSLPCLRLDSSLVDSFTYLSLLQHLIHLLTYMLTHASTHLHACHYSRALSLSCSHSCLMAHLLACQPPQPHEKQHMELAPIRNANRACFGQACPISCPARAVKPQIDFLSTCHVDMRPKKLDFLYTCHVDMRPTGMPSDDLKQGATSMLPPNPSAAPESQEIGGGALPPAQGVITSSSGAGSLNTPAAVAAPAAGSQAASLSEGNVF